MIASCVEVVPSERIAFARQPNCRRQDLDERQLAQARVGQAETRYGPGGRDGAVALDVGVVGHPCPTETAHRLFAGELVHVRSRRQRPAHREAEHAAPCAHLVYEISAPADSAGFRFHDANSEARGNGGIDSVASGSEHLEAGFSRVDVFSGHHPASGSGLGLGDGRDGGCTQCSPPVSKQGFRRHCAIRRAKGITTPTTDQRERACRQSRLNYRALSDVVDMNIGDHGRPHVLIGALVFMAINEISSAGQCVSF